jgi:hypothetical protein
MKPLNETMEEKLLPVSEALRAVSCCRSIGHQIEHVHNPCGASLLTSRQRRPILACIDTRPSVEEIRA